MLTDDIVVVIGMADFDWSPPTSPAPPVPPAGPPIPGLSARSRSFVTGTRAQRTGNGMRRNASAATGVSTTTVLAIGGVVVLMCLVVLWAMWYLDVFSSSTLDILPEDKQRYPQGTTMGTKNTGAEMKGGGSGGNMGRGCRCGRKIDQLLRW